MKKFGIVLAAMLLSVLIADARTVKKVYDIDDFTGINATSAFEVVLEHSDEYRVEIEISEEFLPFLLVKNRGGVLEIKFTRLPFRLKQKNRNKVVRALIKMPTLTYVTLSGASSLISNDQFTNPMEKLTIDLSGGSEIKNLNAKSPEADIRLAGASKAVLSIRSGEIGVDLSGASRLDIQGDCNFLDAKLGGASRLTANELDTEDVSVVAKGASTADVLPSVSLRVELSGASKCRYFGDYEDLKIMTEKIAGASTLKRGN